MKHRFEERLTVDFSVPSELERAVVPQFLLQPLVENALRYGIDPATGAVHLRIHAERTDGVLRLELGDAGPGFPESVTERAPTGVGLTNTASRLYEGSAHLGLENHPAGGARVSVSLPYRELPA